MGRLHTLELENFKSYKGKQIIGPFKQFTAIIGPNGSGKSNMMDAICFVLGEKASNLRVKRLNDLIHGAPVGKPVANKCHVTMNFEDDEGRMRSFTRSVSGAGSEYRIDSKVVTPQQYNHELEEINIFIKAKNFLVYQGQVEQIAMRNPKERTQLFEEISRSCEYQADYDRLKAEMIKAEEDAAFNLNKRRGIAQEKREAKMEKDEAEKYQMMKDDLAAKQRQMYLMQLYHAEKSVANATEELERKNLIVEELMKKKEECDEAVATKQREHKKLLKEVHKMEQKTLEKEKEVTTQKPRYVAAKQEVVHVKTKLETAIKMHTAAQKSAETHEKNIIALKDKITEVEQKKLECEGKLAAESQSLDMQLSDAQVNEYYALKGEATKRCGVLDMELNKLLQERETDKNALQFEQRRLIQATERVKNKENEIERNARQAEHLSENIQSQTALLEDEKKNLHHLENQVRESKEKLEKVAIELNDVSRQLADAHGDTAESERNRRRNEAIDSLKRVFPDRVYGRLVDLCQPSHRRFQLAVTKVAIYERIEVEQKKLECEGKLAAESQSLDMQLSDAQVNEYYALKGEATKRCGVLDMELNKLLQERETDKNALQFEQRRLIQATERVKNKENEIERNARQAEHLSENIQSQTALLEDEKKNLHHLENQVRESKEKLEKVAIELNDVSRQLADAHGDTAESERNRRRNEAIDSLKRVFPDRVYGRLVDLCQPSHRRFQLAVTKVLAKNMMSIVCDTDETARESIVYLKEQRLPPETFLPLSILDVHPINEKLRELAEPRGVKLVFDVIQCNNPVARKALQFACGNALVCETAEDAKYLAYGSASDRYKAIALDGTLFQQNGVISGGGQELKVRARKWDENALRKLKERRAVLMEENQQLHRTRKKELDVEMKRNQLVQLEQRIKYTKNERLKVENQTAKRLEQELETLNGELAVIQPKIDEIEQRMAERDVQIEKLQKKRDSVTDEVFRDFCERIHIKDIRQYEQREMRFHEEMQEQLKKFDNELDRLKNELEYLKSDDKSLREKQEADKVKRLTKDLDDLKKKEEREHKKLKDLEAEYEQMKMEIVSKKAAVEDSECEINVVKKNAQQAAREVSAEEKLVLALEQAIVRRRNERHSILNSCKINGVEVPLIKGSLADVDAEEQAPTTSTEESSQPSQPTQEQMDREAKIKINFRSLPESLKELEDEEEVKKAVEKLAKEVADTQAVISRISAPNLKASERMEIVKEKEAETTEECETARKKARKARQLFEKVKADRYKRFQECFEPVAQKIDEIYKACFHFRFQLSRNESAQAFLGADNMEEPYLEGIAYNCVAPGKRFRPMDNLSGGEKTVAALALLFAMHARNPSPFFVLDEIDAALDNTNIGKVASFISERARLDMQLVVISLKEEFYNKADALVGIYPQPANCTVSGVLTLDLTTFKQSHLDSSAID
ncbi:Structural maintenance of chromosomes protein 1A [Toxocara canis]|uniref:Structural maintenance of chromosomes protein n=1 Tax=Toxocara canis TaxID=6265 RepID=A0A0B2VXM0_TOXCA|nr:Structural maintenance of chromosomes protein 1A [Toxocara canis]